MLDKVEILWYTYVGHVVKNVDAIRKIKLSKGGENMGDLISALISFLTPFVLAWMITVLICGIICAQINGKKGYNKGKGFLWGYLGIIGIIIVACKPDAPRESYFDSSYSERELLNKYSVEEARELILKNGGWKCTFCGRVSSKSVAVCRCGRMANESRLKFESGRNDETKKSIKDIQLEGVKKMLDDGLITEEEYEAKKKILDKQKEEENKNSKKSVAEIQLEGAKKMFEDGLITKEEYEAKRKKILKI